MKLLKYLFLAAIGLVLLTLALANREIVTLTLLPDEMGGYLGRNWAVDLPLFLIVFGGIVSGLLIGFVWEWLREHKHRSAAASARREASKLKYEVNVLRETQKDPEDEILALLEAPRKVG
jgi:uncharacterized integral membrane protein